MKECYFCLSRQILETSAQRKIHFDDEIFTFYLCRKCFGYSLSPKLSDFQLQKLYSLDYVTNLTTDEPEESIPDSKKFARLQEFLNSLPFISNGNLLDYGCGADPMTFKLSQKNRLEPSGMEFSEDVRDAVMVKTGKKVYSPKELMESEELFNIIFLGDVIEHLVNPETELRALRNKLKKGGIPNVDAAARSVLHDWNDGKIKFYCKPPLPQSTGFETKVVTSFSKELDIYNLQEDDIRVLDAIEATVNEENQDCKQSFVGIDQLPINENSLKDFDDSKSEYSTTSRVSKKSSKTIAFDGEEPIVQDIRKVQKNMKKKKEKEARRKNDKTMETDEDYDFNEHF